MHGNGLQRDCKGSLPLCNGGIRPSLRKAISWWALGGSLESPLIKLCSQAPAAINFTHHQSVQNSPVTQLSRDCYANSWSSNSLQGWHYSLSEARPGYLIHKSMYLFPIWKELLTYLVGEISLVHADSQHELQKPWSCPTEILYYLKWDQVGKKVIDFAHSKWYFSPYSVYWNKAFSLADPVDFKKKN